MAFNNGIQQFWDKVQQQAASFREVGGLNPDTFADMITELNAICNQVFCGKNEHLLFIIPERFLPLSTSWSWIWKVLIRVECQKLSSESGEVLSSRLLNIKQFCLLHRELKLLSAMSQNQTESPSEELTASIVMSKTNSIANNDDCGETPCKHVDREEYCICMERTSDVLLDCAHAYCQSCLKQWSACCGHSASIGATARPVSCPLCRATQPSSGADPWLLTEGPDLQESADEMSQVVLRLAERTGKSLP